VKDYGFPAAPILAQHDDPTTFPRRTRTRREPVHRSRQRPPVLGETSSGSSSTSITARQRLLDRRNRSGPTRRDSWERRRVTQSALLAFSGSFPGQGLVPLFPVTVALGYHAVELSVPLNASGCTSNRVTSGVRRFDDRRARVRVADHLFRVSSETLRSPSRGSKQAAADLDRYDAELERGNDAIQPATQGRSRGRVAGQNACDATTPTVAGTGLPGSVVETTNTAVPSTETI